MNRLLLAALATLSLSTCSTSTPPARPAGPQGKMQGPLLVTWEEATLEAGSLSIVARIERRVPLPLTVQVEVPAGATLTRGRQSFELPAQGATGPVLERYQFALSAVPATDLVLRVDGEGGGLTFHGQVPYRFGRPAPHLEVPAATGVGPTRGGVDFGPSVPVGR